MKFNRKLETSFTDITELDKDQFITAVKEKVRYYRLHNFCYLQGPDGKICYLLDNSHAFTVKEVITEHESRLVEPTSILDDTGAETMASVAARFCSYDEFELHDVGLSHLTIDACVSVSLREEIAIRISHTPDFDELPGQIYFMTILETCHASASLDVKGTHESYDKLRLVDYPEENVSALASADLKYLKIMNTDYAANVKTGSKLLTNIVCTNNYPTQ